MTKKILLTIALIFSLNTVITKKAEAGLIVAGIVMAANSRVNEDAAAIVGFSGMLITGGISLMYITRKIPKATFMPFYLIGLSADGSIPQEKLVEDFSNRYHFVNNNDLIVSLVKKIKTKYEAVKVSPNEPAEVNFSVEEVEEHFAGIDLSEKEAKLIKGDLI